MFETRIDAIRSEDEIRAVAEGILEDYEDVPVRSFVTSIVNRRARDLLKERAGVRLAG